MSRSGSSVSRYSWVQVKIRSPSGGASGSVRGVAPTAISTVSASSTSPDGSTTTRYGPASRPVPSTRRTPSRSSRSRMSADCARASSTTRWLTTARSARNWRRAVPSSSAADLMPSSAARSAMVIHSAVAIRVLDGTTSVSTAAPPSPCRSTSVTSAPARRAASAAS